MLDWDDLRFFLAVARHRNLSAAAKELRVAQSTVGRRLVSLESSLGVRLLNRTPEGYVMTMAGEEVLARAERLEVETVALERDVGGRDTRLSGLVRITCAETVASYVLAPTLAQLHAKHPDIMVELIPDPRQLSLSMREADISVRLTQPVQHDLVVRRVGTLGFGLYASPDYLKRHDEIDFEGGCPGHHLITQLNDIQDSEQTSWLAALAPRARVAMQTSSHEAAVVATVHGGGLSCLGRFRADREPGLGPPVAARARPEYGGLAGGPQGQPPQRAHQDGAHPYRRDRPGARPPAGDGRRPCGRAFAGSLADRGGRAAHTSIVGRPAQASARGEVS